MLQKNWPRIESFLKVQRTLTLIIGSQLWTQQSLGPNLEVVMSDYMLLASDKTLATR